MIDIETILFNLVAEKIRGQFPKAFVTGEYVKSPPTFPCVSIMETDNMCNTATATTESVENHSQVLYEINVYSNKTTGKKAECKAIMAFIDAEFLKLGFTRTSVNTIPNELDATVYRMVGRYRAIVSQNNVIYRR